VSANERLLTIEELAEALSVKPSWVMEKGARGEIPSYLVGRYRRFLLSEVLEATRSDGKKDAA